jgi:hypothetical protein
MMPLQDLGTSVDRDDVVVASATEGLSDHYPVDVWSLPNPTLLSRFDTVVDFGGRRLALATKQGRLLVVAAAYDRLGLAGYDAMTGERLWQRTELKRSQRVSPAGELVTASFDRGPTHVLDGSTGMTVATVQGARGFWHSRHGSLGVAARAGHLAGFDTAGWRELWRVRIDGFAVLDAAFSPEAVLASEVVDMGVGDQPAALCSVYCVDLSGTLLWHYESPQSANCPALGWDLEARTWVGVEVDVDGRKADTLIRWSPGGDVISRVGLVRSLGTYWFLPTGRRMISHCREVMDTRTGRVEAWLTAQAHP